MTAVPRISPLSAAKLKLLDGTAYQGAIASLGFEQRAAQIPRALGAIPERLAVPFGSRREHHYAQNERWFATKGWLRPHDPEQARFDEALAAWLGRVLERFPAPRRVAVDISSMSRDRIAAVIELIVGLSPSAETQFDLLYTPAVFKKPDPEDEPPVFEVAPVSAFFAGWWDTLDLPLYAIIGLGYELERASSALDHLEPESAEVYVPIGTDGRYLDAVRAANQALSSTSGIEHEITYNVPDPFSCFRQLEASLNRLRRDFRIALIPLGPKIFAACALLASAMHPEVSQVIRVSAGERQRAVSYRSDSNVYGFSVSIMPSRDSEPEDQASGNRADVVDEHTSR